MKSKARKVAAVRRAQITQREATRAFIQMNAAFDLADRNPEIDEQFGRAFTESGRTALNPQDRRTMIDRSRYEMFQANPWLKGSSRATTVSVIGRGPELEVSLEGEFEEAGKKIEKGFNKWLKKRKVGRKCRAMANAKQSDGAGLAILISRADAKPDEVALDFVPFDCDHIVAPIDRGDHTIKGRCLNGKDIDETGDAVRYWITPEHPVENPLTEPKPVDARFVLDVWDWVRPSQSIGAPEYATTVKNGPLARAYRRATLDTATTAAKTSGVLQTNVDRFEDGTGALMPIAQWVQVPTPYGNLTALPTGWALNQMKAEQPTEGHSEFLRSLAAEHGRGVNQPGFIAVGDGGDLNFSSMAGLRQEWELEVDVQRQDWETECFDKILAEYLREAALIGIVPKEFGDIEKLPHSWRWKKRRHQDTDKEYSGRKTAVASGLRSISQWQMDDGLDPQQERANAAQGFGVTEEQYSQALFLSTFGDAARTVLGMPTQVDVAVEQAKALGSQVNGKKKEKGTGGNV